jgi:hypothetical protein
MKFTSAISAIALLVFAQTVTALPLTKKSSDAGGVGQLTFIATGHDDGKVTVTTITAHLSDIQRKIVGSGAAAAESFKLIITDSVTPAGTSIIQGSITSVDNQ